METKTSSGIVLSADGHQVHYDRYSRGASKVVIIAHGFFNSKNAELLKLLGRELEDQYDVIIMDFRGHGQSNQLFYWTSREYLDLEAIVQFCRQQYKSVGVIGFSLGAATSIITAARSEGIDSVIAVSPPTDFGKIEFHFWDLDVENDIIYSLFKTGRIGKGVKPGPFWQKKEKPINRVGDIKCPILFIHGKSDWLIRPWHSEALYQKATAKKKLAIIENGPHAEYLMRKNKQETVGLIKAWFQDTL